MQLRVLSLILFLAACIPAAYAQQSIQERMSAEEFKAAGLDKLSQQELANLDAWLNGTLKVATEKAAVQAKQKVESENRGFFNFGSDEPIVSTIPGDFRGFGRGREYTLDNGQVWRQTDDASIPGARLTNTKVTIKPSLISNVWYMSVERYNTKAKVERVK